MSSEARPTHFALVTASRNMRTLFDVNLPEDVVERILLMLSPRPRHVCPLFFVEPRDLLAAMGSSNQLRNSALKKFNSIEFTYESWFIPGLFKLDKDALGLRVHDNSLLVTLLDALGGNLMKLRVSSCFAGRPWADVLIREARPVTELTFSTVSRGFPLAKVLRACCELKRLRLEFQSGYSDAQSFLNCVAKHASQIIELELKHLIPKSEFRRIWPKLKLLEVLSISHSTYSFDPSNSDVYAGIAHRKSRLRKLVFGMINTRSHFTAAIKLCHALGHQLHELELSVIQSWRQADWTTNDELSQLKELCPQVVVRRTSTSSFMFSAMRVLRESLIELHMLRDECFQDTEGLADSAAVCTKLRCLSINLYEGCAEEFLELLLSRVGSTLCELNLRYFSRGRALSVSSRTPCLIPLARHTGKLLRLEMEIYCTSSLLPIAVTNPSIRGLAIRFSINRELVEIEKWIVRTIDYFISNCSELEDIVIKEERSRLSERPRIAELDTLLLSTRLRTQRKLGVRIDSMYYDL